MGPSGGRRCRPGRPLPPGGGDDGVRGERRPPSGTAGGYRLDGGPDGAECRRTTDDADLALGIEDLALYLGGVAPSSLAAAGRVTEVRPGALRTADTMLASHPAPFSRTGF